MSIDTRALHRLTSADDVEAVIDPTRLETQLVDMLYRYLTTTAPGPSERSDPTA